jgi:hypothetical protein
LDFLIDFVRVAAMLLILGSPVLIVARRRRRRDTIRNFLVIGGVVALVCATIRLVSDRQVAQCEAAALPDCIDAGAAGLQMVFIVVFLLVDWVVAYSMANDG